MLMLQGAPCKDDCSDRNDQRGKCNNSASERGNSIGNIGVGFQEDEKFAQGGASDA